ncbi:uncharacterized protein LOC129607540 [Condylostylus longicornis]|uniref:uncharacterized protein LOC129607540 n=1 Tax=Condylostylus longicornis TaxID=2530218 RepID=UPI00244E4734|nr:uncharacterized protein LOC129607540 [Condylostylus longicornis]
MIFKNRDFYLILWWSVLIHVNSAKTEREDDHVHIKVHVPQIYKKHFHHKTIAKHHFHFPKKINFQPTHPESVATNIEPEIDFPLLSAPVVDKFIKWQEKPHTPFTWQNSDQSIHDFIPEKLKTLKSPSNIEIDEYKILNGRNNYKYHDLETEYFPHKYAQKFYPHQNSISGIKDFRINIENDYKKNPIKQYSNYRDDEDDEDQEQRDEYHEDADADSYLENTETIHSPSNSPYSPQNIPIISGPGHYYDAVPSSHSNDHYYSTNYNSDSDLLQHGKRAVNNSYKKQKYKRPYRDYKESLKLYDDDNIWISNFPPQNHFSEWSPNIFGKTPPVIDHSKTKLSGRKPFGFSSDNEFQTLNQGGNNYSNNNFEPYFGKNLEMSGLNDYRPKYKRPKRKFKPKKNRYSHSGPAYAY